MSLSPTCPAHLAPPPATMQHLPVISPTFPPLLLLLLSAVLLLLFQCRGGGNSKHRRLRLPPGSMGWPYLGETLKFYTENPNTFFSNRLQRYGEIFKTHILGCPCVMISSPKAARMILVSQAHLFKPTYPPSKEKMIGAEALFFHQGSYHSTLKKLILASFSPAAVRPLLPQIQKIVLHLLPSWCNDSIVNTLEQMKMVI